MSMAALPGPSAALAAALALAPAIARAEDGVETVERVKVFEFSAKPKARVRFTIGTKNAGGVRAALWYSAESPNGDGKKIWHDVERIELHGTNADRTMGPYEMPNGPCAFSLSPGWGGCLVHIRVEVSEPGRDGKYAPFEKKVDAKVRFTSESG